MNVYDFDSTIYAGDSTVDFYRFALKRQPALLRFLPEQIWGIVRYRLGFGTKERMKEHFYSFLRGVTDVDALISSFWQMHQYKIQSWYLQQKKPDDLIISASPEFLLAPVCAQLQIHLLASCVDKKIGKYTGLNCRGKEKLRRYKESYHDKPVECFYSDSVTDLPMAQIAKQAFMVKGNKITRWDVKP